MIRRFAGQAVPGFFSLSAMGSASLLLAKRRDDVAHLFVGSAAADVAAQGFLDLGGRRVGVLVQSGPQRYDEAGRAEAALLRVVLHERGGHGVELAAVGQRLGRLDLLA